MVSPAESCLAALAALLLTVAALSLLRLRSTFSVSGRRSVRGALAPLGQKVICSWLCVLLTTTGVMAAAVAMGIIPHNCRSRIA